MLMVRQATTAPDADGRARQFLGDRRGCVYSRTSASSDKEEDEEGDESWTPWLAELCLHPDSEVSPLSS